MIKHILLLDRSNEVQNAMHKLGYKLTLIMPKSRFNKLNINLYHRIIILEDNASEQEWVNIAESIDSVDKIDYLGVTSEPYEYLGVKIANILKLSYHDFTVVNLTHDKFLMRNKLRDAAIDLTKSKIISPPFKQHIEEYLNEIDQPIIVKPINLRASTGVSKVSDVVDVDDAILWLNKANITDQILLEQFLEGDEYSVECFSEDGNHYCITVTKKFKEDKHFVETGHMVPADITDDLLANITNFVYRALSAMGVQNGPTHTEIMVLNNNVKIIETHLRIGGDMIGEMVNMAYGIDMRELWARQIGGEKVTQFIKKIELKNKVAIKYYVPTNKGELTAINNFEEIKDMHYIQDAKILLRLGSILGELENSDSRILYVIAKTPITINPMSIAVKALEKINIIVKL